MHAPYYMQATSHSFVFPSQLSLQSFPLLLTRLERNPENNFHVSPGQRFLNDSIRFLAFKIENEPSETEPLKVCLMLEERWSRA